MIAQKMKMNKDDYHNVIGVSLDEGAFTVIVLEKWLDGTSVFNEKSHYFSKPLDVIDFINDYDPYCRMILNVLDGHVYRVMWQAREHPISPSYNKPSVEYLNKRIYLEGKGELGQMPNLRSELIFHYQASLGEVIGVPKSFWEHVVRIKFDIGEEGTLRPYWPQHIKLSPIYSAMLTALYPLDLFEYEKLEDGLKERSDEVVEEVAHLGVKERKRRWLEWQSYIEPNRIYKG